MMYTVNYHIPAPLGVAIPAKEIQSKMYLCDRVNKRTVIRFATLEDAFIAAGAVSKIHGCTVYVSDTENPEGRYMIPKRYREC